MNIRAQKAIALTLYALLVVGACFTLPVPAAKASCDAYCLLENCQIGPGGIHFGWVRGPGNLFVTLTTPQHCVSPDNLYVSCSEKNYGCSSVSGATYKINHGMVYAYNKKRLLYSMPANQFNAYHQKELAASIRTCQQQVG